MISFLNDQYDNLINFAPFDPLPDPKELSQQVISKIESIPKGYLIGTPPNAIPLIVSTAKRLQDFNPDVIIDIGSGKGYLARLLANYLNKRVLCIDSNPERLSSTVRWDRLINDSNFSQTKTTIVNQKGISNNIKVCNMSLDTIEDFKSILSESRKWLNNQSPNQQLALVALKNCGDMVYRLIDFYHEVGDSQLILVIVPCCYNKITQFPYSDQLKSREFDLEVTEGVSDILYLLDMMFYSQNKGFSVDINYEFDNYVSFTIKR